jgi:mycofactocin precursor
MPDYPLTESVDASGATEQAEAELPGNDLVEEEILVEEISIDGMCGVY